MAQARTWREADGQTRLRMRLRHPMDTGLAKDNTPAFHIERFDARGSGGEMLATVLMQEPVSEDPTVTLLLRPAAGDATIETEARDNNGGVYRSTIPAALTE
jgi:sulfur-oxidizing protein SoxY